VSHEPHIHVRLDATGGGATVSVDGEPESYTYALGNVMSRFGSLALLGDDAGMDGGEEVYKERLRAELLAQMTKHGVRVALRNVFGITDDDRL
jgi:hypothetical protein